MSIADKIIEVMKFDVEYDAVTVASMIHEDENYTAKIMNMLADGNILEPINPPHRYKKRRSLKSRQRKFFDAP